MRLLHNIGEIGHPNYNTREEIIRCKDPLGFDGIYRNVYENRDVLKGKSGILFVMGDYVGKDNTFDLKNVPRLEKYCTWGEILQICKEYDFEVGWHTYSHPDLTKLTKAELLKEVMPPFPMKYFAYPYGRFNDLVIEAVKFAGYERAYSVTQGSMNPDEKDYKFKIFRDYL